MAKMSTDKIIPFAPRRGAFYVERAPLLVPSDDGSERKRWTLAPIGALLLHILVLLLLLFGMSLRPAPVPPPPIPVEVVMVPPPTPKAAPVQTAKPPPRQPPAPPTEQMESGGSPDLATGRPAAKAPVKEGAESAKPVPPKPAPPAKQLQGKAEPALTKAVPEPKPAREAATPQYTTPFLVPHADVKVPQQQASLPQQRAEPILTYPPGAPSASTASAPEFSESERSGEGGGSRYLNAMRDTILSNLIYPLAAQGSSGIAKYRILVGRNGLLLGLRMVESSGSPALDRAGSDAIQNSVPFQPLPANIIGDTVVISVMLIIAPK
jgi:periplasmic protein TonB